MKDLTTNNNKSELEQIRNLFEGTLNQDDIPAIIEVDNPESGIVSIVQPKSVTYSLLPDNRVLEEVLTETIRCLQPFMTKNPVDCYSSNNVDKLFVPIDFSKIAGFCRDRQKILKAIEYLESFRFEFGWVQKEFVGNDGKLIPEKEFKYSGNLFIGHLAEKNNWIYRLHINSFALPYLTFIGKGVGYTEFDYSIYTSLNSTYLEKLYKYLCEWSNLGPVYSISVQEFKKLLSIGEKTTISMVEKRYISYLKNFLKESKAKLQFDYEISHNPDDNDELALKKKRTKNWIKFIFHTPERNVTSLVDKKIKALENILLVIADTEKRSAVPSVVNAIVEADLLDKILSKCNYYSNKRNKGQIDDNKLRNTLLKIIRDSVPGADLRSSKHIRNASIKKARAKYSGD